MKLRLLSLCRRLFQAPVLPNTSFDFTVSTVSQVQENDACFADELMPKPNNYGAKRRMMRRYDETLIVELDLQSVSWTIPTKCFECVEARLRHGRSARKDILPMIVVCFWYTVSSPSCHENLKRNAIYSPAVVTRIDMQCICHVAICEMDP